MLRILPVDAWMGLCRYGSFHRDHSDCCEGRDRASKAGWTRLQDRVVFPEFYMSHDLPKQADTSIKSPLRRSLFSSALAAATGL